VSGYLAEAMAAGSIRAPRDVGLEAEFQDVLPPLELNMGPGELAGIFATVLQRDHTPPSVAVDHIHLPLVSVSEQRGHILGLLRAGEVVVARFLALLELFKVGLCDFDQPEPLGRLLIHRTEMSEDSVDLRTEGAWSDEEDEHNDGGDEA
jgi:segregation and condensation protein A